MTILGRWLEYLNKTGIRYSHSIHPRAQSALETADAERMPAHDLAKPVVYFCETGFGMAVVPADEFVDLPEVARLLGLSYIRLANEGELAELFTDSELGAMPPFGHLYQMPVLLDGALAGREFIAFNLGTHRDVVRMSVEDYLNLVKPLVGSIVVREECLVS